MSNEKRKACTKCGGAMLPSNQFAVCKRCLQSGLKAYTASAPPRSAMINEETRDQLYKVFGPERAENLLATAEMSCRNWYKINPTKARELTIAEDQLSATIEAWFLAYIQCAVDIECTNAKVGMS